MTGQKQPRMFLSLTGSLILAGVGVVLGGVLFARGDNLQIYLMLVFIQILSVLVTVSLVEDLIRWRERRIEEDRVSTQQQQADDRLRADLVNQLRSSLNSEAVNAALTLRERGWLTDGLLKGAFLSGANLQRGDLSGGDLTGAKLVGATLKAAALRDAELGTAQFDDADLTGAALDRARLNGASLRRARLGGASLRLADLSGADLRLTACTGTDFHGARLNGADCTDADWQHATLADAQFDSATRLPDGSTWSAGGDLARFTDPAHPDFWRSNNAFSPASAGADDEDDAETER